MHLFTFPANLSLSNCKVFFVLHNSAILLGRINMFSHIMLGKVWEFLDECSFDHSHCLIFIWASTTCECVCVGMKTGFWIDNKLHLKEEINTDIHMCCFLRYFTFYLLRLIIFWLAVWVLALDFWMSLLISQP